ncbi:MAG: RIP metalloprotease RseP [Clostridiaceae bacterium]
MNLVMAFIAFNIIIIVHELGHFLTAKKFGIKVLEFSLFIGPKLFSFQKGDTTYSLRLIPLLAYVKMEGEEEFSDSESAFCKKPKHARALTAFGGPFANLLLAAVLLTVYFTIQGYDTTKVSRVAENLPAAAAGIQPGDKILSYDGKRVYQPMDIYQFLYISKGVPAKVEYIRDGKRYTETIKPYIIPAAVAPKLGVSIGSENDADSNVIKALSPGYPAEKIGLQVGDRIIALNDTEIKTARELVDFVTQNGLKPIILKAIRGNSEVNVKITPVEVKSQEMYDIGMDFILKKAGFFDALGESAVFTWSIVRSTGYSLVWLINGQAKLNEMMGPIGMVSTIGTVVEQAPNVVQMLLNIIYMTALFSIALGATNLLPFPMLDGGRLVLIGLEAVRGKPLSQKKEAYISMVGFVLIILLGIYAAYNDIVRLVTG